jgi:hypothetical protein
MSNIAALSAIVKPPVDESKNRRISLTMSHFSRGARIPDLPTRLAAATPADQGHWHLYRAFSGDRQVI